MRLLPTLFLVVFLVPTSSNTGWAGIRDWQKPSMPMAGHPQPGLSYPYEISVSSPDRSIPEQAITQAIDAWNDVLIDHPFRRAQPGESPVVSIRVVKQVEGQDVLQGQIYIESGLSKGDRATVEISDQNGGVPIGSKALGAVLTHELGHFLGLDDAPADSLAIPQVMGEFDPDNLVTRPSSRESQLANEHRLTNWAVCRI